jgi:hypothetical protein
MIDGKIEYLGERLIMLPHSVVSKLQMPNAKSAYSSIKKIMKKEFEYYTKLVGNGEEGKLKNLIYIFETFGLGRLEIVDINNKNKVCKIKLYNSSLKKGKNAWLVSAILAGMFSFLFDKDVNAKRVQVKIYEHDEYFIK